MPLVPPSEAVFLGKTTPLAASAATTPTLVIGPGWGKLWIYHYIAGYSGGGIARIQVGNGTTVDTGSNYSCITMHTTAGSTTLGTPTSRVSQAGIQVANDSVTAGRRGLHEVFNPPTDPKTFDGRTATYSTAGPYSAASAYATLSFLVGTWWNTTAQIQCVAMDGGGSVNLLAGSYISVYGCAGLG